MQSPQQGHVVLKDTFLRLEHSITPTYLALVVLLSVAWAPRHT